MTAKIQFTVTGLDGEGLGISVSELRKAQMDTLADLADEIETAGAAHIRAAGFTSGSWWKSFRAKVYEDSRSIYAYHPIPFSAVFEDQTEIKGKPFLWFPTTRSRLKDGRLLTPSRFRREVGPLVERNGKNGTKVLMASAMVPRAFAYPAQPPQIGLENFTSAAQKKQRINPRSQLGLVKRAVTAFIGIRGYRSKKRLDLKGVARRVIEQAETVFFKKLNLE